MHLPEHYSLSCDQVVPSHLRAWLCPGISADSVALWRNSSPLVQLLSGPGGVTDSTVKEDLNLEL